MTLPFIVACDRRFGFSLLPVPRTSSLPLHWFLCVSVRRPVSRWMSPHNPDVGTSVTGEQFGAVRAFLQDHMEVHFVSFDFSCLPQTLKATDGTLLQKLNPAEEVYFEKALSWINLLYVHGKVLVLLDAEYCTRFWCL